MLSQHLSQKNILSSEKVLNFQFAATEIINIYIYIYKASYNNAILLY